MEGNTFVNTVTSFVVSFKCFVFGLSLSLLFGLLLLILLLLLLLFSALFRPEVTLCR